MSLPDTIDFFFKRTGMFIHPANFETICAFLSGYDAALGGSLLDGFGEWLIPQLDGYNNLGWEGLVLEMCFPEGNARKRLSNSKHNERAVKRLIELVTEYYKQRAASNGKRKIYVIYELWLRKQGWYRPGDPDYFALELPKPIKPRRRKAKRER